MEASKVKRGMTVQIDYDDKEWPRYSYHGQGKVLRKAEKEYGNDCFECMIEKKNDSNTGVFGAEHMTEIKQRKAVKL